MTKSITMLLDAELDLVTGGCGCTPMVFNGNNVRLNDTAEDHILANPAGDNGFQGRGAYVTCRD